VTGWEAVSFEELDAIPVAEGLVWHPVRRRLGIHAFGINAYSSEAVGRQVVEKHTEAAADGTGHEEVYVVVRGRATFTIGGETVEAPAGTLVFIRDPLLERVAISEEEGTLVLAVGGEPGRAFEPSAWEWRFAALPAISAGRHAQAISLLEEGLREKPGDAGILYDLACAEALDGRPLAALTHLQEAVHANPGHAERARVDPDLESIRCEPGFPA
jgi:tetratricopeptide (TPR) repeat protein